MKVTFYSVTITFYIKEIIKDAKSSVKNKLLNLELDQEGYSFLKQLVEEKGDNLGDWLRLKDEYTNPEKNRKLLDFVHQDLLINKENTVFKYKNDLVREVLTGYFMGDKESK